jgi:hypothetical protein
MISNQQPSITTGLRGLSYVKWKLLDLTVIYIPVYTVVQLPINQYFGKMIASLHDENNHITIPGFMTMSKNYLLKKAEMAKALLA